MSLAFLYFWILFNRNSAILLKACNPIPDEISHAILFQPCNVILFLNLLQGSFTGSIHISVLRVFQFYYNSQSVSSVFPYR